MCAGGGAFLAVQQRRCHVLCVVQDVVVLVPHACWSCRGPAIGQGYESVRAARAVFGNVIS